MGRHLPEVDLARRVQRHEPLSRWPEERLRILWATRLLNAYLTPVVLAHIGTDAHAQFTGLAVLGPRAGDQRLAIRRESDVPDRKIMLQRRTQRLAREQIPKLHCSVLAARHRDFAVRRERHAPGPIIVRQRKNLAARSVMPAPPGQVHAHDILQGVRLTRLGPNRGELLQTVHQREHAAVDVPRLTPPEGVIHLGFAQQRLQFRLSLHGLFPQAVRFFSGLSLSLRFPVGPGPLGARQYQAQESDQNHRAGQDGERGMSAGPEPVRSRGPTGLARIGSPRRNRPRSSARARALG